MAIVQSKITTPNPGTAPHPHEHYWVKVYSNPPFSIDLLGPFETKEKAQQERCAHMDQLRAEGKRCISSFQLFAETPPSMDSHFMSHRKWLHSLMEDYLHVKVPYQ